MFRLSTLSTGRHRWVIRTYFNLGAALTQPAERLLAQEQVLERWRRYQHVASVDFSDQTSEDQD